jgi:hypothetical protein
MGASASAPKAANLGPSRDVSEGPQPDLAHNRIKLSRFSLFGFLSGARSVASALKNKKRKGS